MGALNRLFSSVDNWLDLTFFLILVFLVLTNWRGFSAVIGSTVGGYTSSVRALQGR